MMTTLDTAGSITTSLPNLEEVIALARRNSLTRDNPLLADLPAWFSGFRDHQRVAIREILLAYEEGAECVVLDASTGSGKTLVGETVRRLLPGVRQSTYICSSKSLQDQFIRDYPYAKVLKGRSNYATELYPERFNGGRDALTAADCTKNPGDPESCLWCSDTHRCPYESAKSDALRSSLAILNTSYFLSECNGPGRFSRGGLVIADEADTLESELMGHVEVRISERRLKQYGLGTPKFVTKEESWREWIEEALEKVSRYPTPRGQELADIRARSRHERILDKLRLLHMELPSGGWVYTGSRESVEFKPVTVSSLGQAKLWRHGDKWLLMSATVISADELLESLGWPDDKEWRLVKVPSTFKPENRKVVVWPAASMTHKNKDIAYPQMVEAVKKVLSLHPDERVLIHTSSYELTRAIREGVESLPAGAGAAAPPCRPVVTYSESAGKERSLANWLATPNGVLVAPSMERGIDLPGDQCRAQIICKVPYRSLGDKQVSTRVWGGGRAGKTWYAVDAIRTIVQSCGRIVRSEDDFGVTYLLDSQFYGNLWPSYRRLFPGWWVEAIEWRTKGL